LLAVLHPLSVQRSSDDVVATSGKILYSSPSNQHHGVFLQVVSNSRDVTDDLCPVGQADLCHFAQGGVWLFRGRSVDPDADPASLWTLLKSRGVFLCNLAFPSLADELTQRGHVFNNVFLSVLAYK